MGYTVNTKPTNEIPDIDLDSYYSLSGETVLQGQVLILVFADPVNDSSTYINFMKNIQTVINGYNSSNIKAIGVLYQSNSEIDGASFLSYCDSLTASGVNYSIVNNGAWNNSAAAHYSSVVTSSPFCFPISKNYLIASINPSDIAATVASLMAGPSILALDPASASTLNALSAMSVSFSEAVSGGATKGNYALGGAGKGTLSVSSASADGTTANKYNLALGGKPADGDLTVTISNITDTVFYTPVALKNSVITYYIDISAPAAVLSSLPSKKTNVTSIAVTVGGTDVTAYSYKLDSGSWSAETAVAVQITAAGLSEGAHTLSVVARDTVGNWQTESAATTCSWTVDFSIPVITSFSLTSQNPTALASITFDLSVSDNDSVAGYCINESSAQPGAGDSIWTNVKPASYAMSNTAGKKEIYAWVQDEAGNVSALTDKSHFSVTLAVADTTPPRVLAVKMNPR